MRYKALVPIILALLLAGGLYGAYAYGPADTATHALTITEDPVAAAGFPAATESPANDTTVAGPLAPPREAPMGQKEYRSERYRFALFYPENLKVESYDEGGGVSTIVFENDVAATGFQIFITPYGARQVSAERFKKDVPSGVIREPQQIAIDGALATMFLSRDMLLGETREVWFVHGGYLFEVSTLRALDADLARIMQTWIFI
jgi:hypothetical protein